MVRRSGLLETPRFLGVAPNAGVPGRTAPVLRDRHIFVARTLALRRRMNRLSTSLVSASLIAAGWMALGSAQGREDPFFDRADTGEILHVLPTPASIRPPKETQPTDAPPARGTAVYLTRSSSSTDRHHPSHLRSQASAFIWTTSRPIAASPIRAFKATWRRSLTPVECRRTKTQSMASTSRRACG